MKSPAGQTGEAFQVNNPLGYRPGSSHSFRLNGRPSHRLDYYRRVVAWLERYTSVVPDGN
jgi:hypothetical protein